jgi:hypothetical protein
MSKVLAYLSRFCVTSYLSTGSSGVDSSYYFNIVPSFTNSPITASTIVNIARFE